MLETDSKKKILLVFGTRPEAIKMAPLVKEFKSDPDKFETFVCVTGQHRQMLDQVLHLFQIVPDFDLDIMQSGQDLYDITSRVLVGMRDVLKDIKPDLVLVHGDTTTSMATALAAFYQRIDVGHVEAGLRTHNLYSPWPEELNRQLTSRIAKYNFSPTELSKQNLLKENVDKDSIYVTGNTVIDALHWVSEKINSDKEILADVERQIEKSGYETNRLLSGKQMVLITGHRRENFGEGFANICNALDSLSLNYPDVDFVYPVHLNPIVRESIARVFNDNQPENLYLIEPLDYLPFISLMGKSKLVLTDSGGIQEEAPGLGKPVLVMRNTTERPEAVDAGTVKLVGADSDRIIAEVSRLLDESDYYSEMAKAVNPYGDGKAAPKIVKIISEQF